LDIDGFHFEPTIEFEWPRRRRELAGGQRSQKIAGKSKSLQFHAGPLPDLGINSRRKRN